jgi:anti-sigma factor RsiW
VDCRDVERLLHPYLDGELDLIHAAQVEHHVAECTACAEARRGLLALREAVGTAPYHAAPASLRRKLLQDAPRRPARRRLVALAACAVAAAVLAALLLGPILRAGQSERRVAEQVVANHVRSLQVQHLTDVASSDRHEVKPWFDGKLDYSPPIIDLADRHFPLTGGRLDYLEDRPVAALVYRRRQHKINVFVWPARDAGDAAVRSRSRQGYHLIWWERGGMTFWVVSDLNASELSDFATELREREARP